MMLNKNIADTWIHQNDDGTYCVYHKHGFSIKKTHNHAITFLYDAKEELKRFERDRWMQYKKAEDI